MPDYIAGGGIKNTEEEIRNATVWLRQKTIAELASEYNEATTSVGPANELNNFLTAEFCALIFDNSNLTAAKAASICDSANITSAKIKAILDTGSLTVADKIAALLDGDSLTADDAATHVNSGTYTDDLMASAFDSSYLAAAKAASIMDNSNLTAAKAASIMDNSNLTAAKLQSILDNTNLTIQKGQEIVDAMSDPTKIGTGGRRGIIGDDWADNKLTSRDNAATVATALDKVFQTFRPEWTTVAGAPTLTDGILTIANGDKITISPGLTEGSFEVKLRATTGGTGPSGTMYVAFIYQDDNNNIGIYEWEPMGLGKVDGGTYTHLISDDNPSTTQATFKFTRDASGNYEFFKDGVSQGTTTDTFLPTNNNIAIWSDRSEDIEVDDLKEW